MSIILSQSEWEDFLYRLNNPSQEQEEARLKFLDECNKTIIVPNGNGGWVQYTNLNEDEILKCLDAAKKNLERNDGI